MKYHLEPFHDRSMEVDEHLDMPLYAYWLASFETHALVYVLDVYDRFAIRRQEINGGLDEIFDW